MFLENADVMAFIFLLRKFAMLFRGVKKFILLSPYGRHLSLGAILHMELVRNLLAS